jgi:hypothetical protein
MKNGQGAGITSRALTVLWREFSRNHRTMQASASTWGILQTYGEIDIRRLTSTGLGYTIKNRNTPWGYIKPEEGD